MDFVALAKTLPIMLLLLTARRGWRGVVWPLGLVSGLCMALSMVAPGPILTLLAAAQTIEALGR